MDAEALRGEDGVYRVFQHQHPVGNRQRQCAAAVALSSDDGQNGHRQAAHLKEVPGDGLALAVGLRLQARVGPGGIHKGEDGAAELFRLPHKPPGLPVAFRIGHPEVALEVFLQGLALAGTDDGDGAAVIQSDTAHDGGVLTAETVALATQRNR